MQSRSQFKIHLKVWIHSIVTHQLEVEVKESIIALWGVFVLKSL